MRRLALSALCVLALTGCQSSAARKSYIAANAALNACLLANPTDTGACKAQREVMDNDLMLYSNLSN
jgi:hypothetical protein